MWYEAKINFAHWHKGDVVSRQVYNQLPPEIKGHFVLIPTEVANLKSIRKHVEQKPADDVVVTAREPVLESKPERIVVPVPVETKVVEKPQKKEPKNLA